MKLVANLLIFHQHRKELTSPLHQLRRLESLHQIGRVTEVTLNELCVTKVTLNVVILDCYHCHKSHGLGESRR
jgi:hypothetical protein